MDRGRSTRSTAARAAAAAALRRAAPRGAASSIVALGIGLAMLATGCAADQSEQRPAADRSDERVDERHAERAERRGANDGWRLTPGERRFAPGDGRLTPGESWWEAPVVPTFDRQARQRLKLEVARSRAAGSRAGVFAKIGDSNSDYPANLYGLGCRPVRFAPRYRDLAPTLRRYRSTRLGSLRTFPGCRPANSFSRDSAAAVAGVWTRWLLTPVADLPLTEVIEVSPECGRRQTPLGCELNLLRPRYALIMIGSNDVVLGRPLGPFLATQLARVISRVRAHGTVPVLSTLPPLGEYIPGNDQIEEVNALIVHVARRLRVPLINVWRAMQGPRMINEGLGLDDVHLGAYQGDTSPEILRHSAVLTKEAIRNGANRRNLLWLQVLRRLDRVAGSGRR